MQRHAGEDAALLAKRDEVYATAKARHPRRWSAKTRDWTPVGSVYLNPEDPALHVTCKNAA